MKLDDPVVYFVSTNNGISLYRSDYTEVKDGYVYNIYSLSHGYDCTFKHHKKLKLRKTKILENYYVEINDRRCFLNSLIKNKERLYELVDSL
jgi:hypothetical protein